MNKSPSRKKHYLPIALIILVIIAVTWGGLAYINRPQDLGPKLHYIGKSSSFCLFFCNSIISTQYFFSTDMGADELSSYFPGMELTSKSVGYSQTQPELISTAWLIFKKQGQDKKYLTISMDGDVQSIVKEKHLKDTNQRYIVELGDDSYEVAKGLRY